METEGEEKDFKRSLYTYLWILPLCLFIFFNVYLGVAVKPRMVFIFIIGWMLGVTLVYSQFAFCGCFRHAFTSFKLQGLRSVIFAIFITAIFFSPFLIIKPTSILEPTQPVKGMVAPVSLSVLIGSFLFGIGMQLSNVCASGALYASGMGKIRGMIGLISFIFGTQLGAISYTVWKEQLPHMNGWSFLDDMPWFPGMVLHLTLLAVCYVVCCVVEYKAVGIIEDDLLRRMFSSKYVMEDCCEQEDIPLAAEQIYPEKQLIQTLRSILYGGWNRYTGAIVLSVLQLILLIFSSHAWGVMGAFTLWGSKILCALGVNVQSWPYWQHSTFDQGILENDFSVLDIAILIGAFRAAVSQHKFGKGNKEAFGLLSYCAAVIGGLLLGFGSRWAYGCNIGSLFSGLSSYSLHGWVWLIGGVFGNFVGVYCRPLFQLENPHWKTYQPVYSVDSPLAY